MRTLDADFISEKNLEANSPIFLYTIFDYDGNGNNLCVNSWDDNITFDGVLYNPAVVVHEKISQNISGEVDAVTLTIGNIDRILQSYLENIDYRRKKVTIKRIFYDQISNPLAYAHDSYYIEEYEATEQEITFTLTSVFNLLGVKLPGRLMSRNFCSRKFPSCGYSGTEISCNKTLARCRQLGNQLNYGGFPCVPARRVLNG